MITMMTMPDTDGIVSDQCLLSCEDGKRRVGYYHCNGHWYEMLPHKATLLDIKVLSWEYLNPPTSNEVST